MKHVSPILQVLLWFELLLAVKSLSSSSRTNPFAANSHRRADTNDKGTNKITPLCRFQGCSDLVASRRGFLVLSTAVAWASLLPPQPSSAAVGASAASSSASAKTSTRTSSSDALPFSSVRKYKSIQLSNGMRCVLVSSKPNTIIPMFVRKGLTQTHTHTHLPQVSDKSYQLSTACISIQDAGQFSDPPGLNGFAHLMEHTVLSTRSARSKGRKWEIDFDDWISDYGGYSNGEITIGMMNCHPLVIVITLPLPPLNITDMAIYLFIYFSRVYRF